MADNRIKAVSNLYGELIDGKSICAGYSEILRNIKKCISRSRNRLHIYKG